MKTFRLFSMAALSLMMAACSSEDNALENATPAMPGLIPFSATVAPLSGATTRTVYTPGTDGESKPIINVAWKEGDQIFIARLSPDLGTAGRVTVGKPNDDGSAPLSGDISGADGNEIEAYYPASAYDDWGIFTDKYIAQDGTLSGIQDNLDYRKGTGKISVIGGKATLADKLQMKSQIAIWKLTLQNTSGANLNATKVTIKDGSNIIAATKDISATSEVHMAVPFNTSPTTFSDLTIEATTADGTYTYAAPSAVNLSHSTYYQSTVTMAKLTDLSSISGTEYTVQDGEVLTGTLASNVKISIADGATVTLKNVNITNLGDNCNWAGINCPGNATLVLEGTNEVCAGRDESGNNSYPGIWIASGKTLTIQGDGTLTAYSNGTNPYGAGIGGGYSISCGNIVINSGNITATGGQDAAGIGGNTSCGNITINGGTITATGGGGGAGIGGGYYASCGNIEISGGTVTAKGGSYGAGIGGGNHNGTCGTITITSGVTSVTATKGGDAPNSIGAGLGGTAITVSIGGVEGAITTSPCTYPEP